MKDLKFKILNTDQKENIVNFRKNVFQDYYSNRVNLDGLNWQNADDKSLHLAYVLGDQLVSYMRLIFFQTKARLIQHTIIEIDNLPLPISLISRSSTLKDYANFGLHSRLRRKALEICLHYKVYANLSNIEKDSHRIHKLLQEGYSLIKEYPPEQSGFYTETTGLALIKIDGLIPFQKFIIHNLEKYKDDPINTQILPDNICFI